ncbi:hypothetical protein VTO73DRAFT_109 [Trametes versicolor]
MKFIQSFAALALLALGVQAAPHVKRDGSSSSSQSASSSSSASSTSLDPLSVLASAFPSAATLTSPDQILTAIQANSQAAASAVGTGAILEVEASLVMAQAMTAISPTETQLSLFMADVAGTPIVQVSSIGGPAITLATGTAASAFPTSFAGHVFTAAPKTNHAVTDMKFPKALVAGALTMIGSIAVGAIAVL